MTNHRAAFSLVELSIVLVILGLLVGGVLGGQSLIKAAQLRNILTEKEKYVVAINAFQGKYNALPGDMSNATSYWTPAHATNSTCLTTARSGGTTCNGNGNGDIGGYANGTCEVSLAWEHLSNAGLVEGRYLGYTSGMECSNYTVISPATTPASKFTGAYWAFMSAADIQARANSAGLNVWPGKYKHQLVMSSFGTGYTNEYSGVGVVPPEDAFAVDGKVDDGKPGTGSVRALAYNTTAGSCTASVTAGDGPTTTYSISNASGLCKPMFDLGF